MSITRRSVASGLAASLAMPAPLRHARGQSAALRIGMVLPLTGPAAESGRSAFLGARLALERVNKAGGVLSRPLELVLEDDQTSNPGAAFAFTRLADQPDIVAFLGSIRSTQTHAMAADVLKAGKPVCFGGTDPNLTKLGNPWLFRFRPNDTFSARVMAAYGVGILGKKNWALVHSTDPFGSAGAKMLAQALEARGARFATVQTYRNNSQDFSPPIEAIKASGADVLATYFPFDTDLVIFAKQLREMGADLPWIGSSTVAVAGAVQQAGAALHGTYGVVDYAEDASVQAKEFGALYRAASNGLPPDIYSAWTFDAVNVLAMAIAKAGSTEPDKIRAAILSIKGYPGAEGDYDFDADGDGLHGYNIVRNMMGAIVFEDRIDFAA